MHQAADRTTRNANCCVVNVHTVDPVWLKETTRNGLSSSVKYSSEIEIEFVFVRDGFYFKKMWRAWFETSLSMSTKLFLSVFNESCARGNGEVTVLIDVKQCIETS
jgi:hypothetical protein